MKRESERAAFTGDFNFYERALGALRERALSRISTFESQFDGIVAYVEGSPPDDEHDPEGSTIAFERAQLQALLSQAKADLSEIDAALRRVADGSFGICERCSKPIAAQRLEVRPHARRCAACS